jgi:hypothetical protein
MAMDNVDPAGRGFLGDLAPSVLPAYQYRDREQLLNTISRITNEKSPLCEISISPVQRPRK